MDEQRAEPPLGSWGWLCGVVLGLVAASAKKQKDRFLSVSSLQSLFN